MWWFAWTVTIIMVARVARVAVVKSSTSVLGQEQGTTEASARQPGNTHNVWQHGQCLATDTTALKYERSLAED